MLLKLGTADESRQLMQTDVSGSNGQVSSKTYHWNRVRVSWDDGSSSFYDFVPSVSKGDRVAVAYFDGADVASANLVTGDWHVSFIEFGSSKAILSLAFFVLCMPFMGLLSAAGATIALICLLYVAGMFRKQQITSQVRMALNRLPDKLKRS